MNAVEIEQAVSELALQPFDPAEFPFQFLAAFGHKETALRRLRAGNNNASDVAAGVLLRNNIHLAVAEPGEVAATLAALRGSPANVKGKPKFLLATDGTTLEAEDLASGETIACAWGNLPNHFGFLLPLAGISTIKEIKDNPIDVRATSRLNKLYVTLLEENPDWATEARRADMNHFMARLIFCFFAEDTGIFRGESLFTRAVEQMTERDGSNVHTVLSEIFRAMDIHTSERATAEPRLPAYAIGFPYVNGELFSGSTEVPRFTRMARTYLLHAGGLDWKAINPDIFGSMIQAVADDEERGALGMHYTSVPNILKVLSPLFLDDLWSQLEAAGQDKRKLLALRRRIARIRVFDPACGSGNFLVIAYKRMRAIEAEINDRRGERDRKSEIPLTNFRGIELRHFPAEIARLALIIAEFQSDELYRGQREALAEFLPLAKENWIVCDNALRLDWLAICPPSGPEVRVVTEDLLTKPVEQAEVEFINQGGETYLCSNPPYLGARNQGDSQKADIHSLFGASIKNWKSLDYVSGWFIKAAEFCGGGGAAALVATNSICQGVHVPLLWPLIFECGIQIGFAHTSFKWSNLATHNAGVTVVIVGLSKECKSPRRLYSVSSDGSLTEKQVERINAYLVNGSDVIVDKAVRPLGVPHEMASGNTPIDGGNLLLSRGELEELGLTEPQRSRFVRRIFGSSELIQNTERYCLWIEDQHRAEAEQIPAVRQRIQAVEKLRLDGGVTAKSIATKPHQFQRMLAASQITVAVPVISSESREYLPCGLLGQEAVISNKCFGLYDAPIWVLSVIASRLHLVWIGAVCPRLEMRFSYSNTLGWNTFPVPLLTDENKAELTRCAEAILLAREASFPKTIADLYDPETMPESLRRAHECNDEVLERIYIGRRFRNDTERLEKLFDLYTKMTAEAAKKPAAKSAVRGKKV
jgi:hypothetical protein